MSVVGITSEQAGGTVGGLARLGQAIADLGDRLNPILVKETRQALKSRQFTFTFVLVLIACWAWTFLGLAFIGPGAAYSAEAADMFYGYYMILAFPLAIIAWLLTTIEPDTMSCTACRFGVTAARNTPISATRTASCKSGFAGDQNAVSVRT